MSPCGTSRALVPAATWADSDAGRRSGHGGHTVPGGAVIKTGQTRAETRSHAEVLRCAASWAFMAAYLHPARPADQRTAAANWKRSPVSRRV